MDVGRITDGVENLAAASGALLDATPTLRTAQRHVLSDTDAPPSFAANAGQSESDLRQVAGLVAAAAVGALGSIAAGRLADQLGRTAITATAMAASGTIAVLTALLFGQAPALVIAVAMVWGLTVVADSALFSAALSELSEPERVGSALAEQTAIGFQLTAISIQLLPLMQALIGGPRPGSGAPTPGRGRSSANLAQPNQSKQDEQEAGHGRATLVITRAYGQPRSASGVTIASLSTSSGGALAIQTINVATSSGGSASVAAPAA